MNIIKEMGLSIYSYKTYTQFLNNRKSKVFGFGIVLMIFYFLLTIGFPFAKSIIEIGGIGNYIKENVPDFELEDGYLWIDDIIEYEDSDIYVCIDTDPDLVFYDAAEMEDYLYGYSQVLLIDSEKLIVKDKGQVQGLYFSELDINLNKEDIVRFVPTVYLFIGIGMFWAYIWMTALFFFGVLFVALIGMIIASCMKYQLTFGQLYLLGIYSRTLPLIIKALLSYLPIDIPFFFIINFGISAAILVAAIQKMKEQRLQTPLEFYSDGSSNKNDFSWMQ